jgi:hypothetical protein
LKQFVVSCDLKNPQQRLWFARDIKQLFVPCDVNKSALLPGWLPFEASTLLAAVPGLRI